MGGTPILSAIAAFLTRLLPVATPWGIEWAALEWDAGNFLRLGGWALLGAFLPVQIFVSVGIKRGRSTARLKTLLRAYNLRKDRYFQLYRDSKKYLCYWPLSSNMRHCSLVFLFRVFANLYEGGNRTGGTSSVHERAHLFAAETKDVRGT